MIEFREEELKIKEISQNFRGTQVPVFHFPVSPKEEWKNMVQKKKPVWLNTNVEYMYFCPSVIPDNIARGMAGDGGKRIPDSEKGGKDMFGVEWVYVPSAGGSMEKPGVAPILDDIENWKEKIVFPDIDSWDWEGSAKINEELLKTDKFVYMPMVNGFTFERLISFMGFEDAAVALIDESQEDALKELLDATSDLYVKIIEKCCDYYAVDGFVVHDDWGSQKAPFFSVDAGKELLVPYMKKVTDYIHARGKVAELHSCGCNERQIENYIAAGWDIWNPMENINDTHRLYEEYGDQIIIGVKADNYDPEKDSEEKIREKAREFVQKFCTDPEKICMVNRYSGSMITGCYAEELYKESRKVYQSMS